MAGFSLKARLREALNFSRNRNNDLAPSSSLNSSAAQFIVSSASVLLVLASAGFGALFAWSTGSQHNVMLGLLSVAMALGLEASKPFAIAAAFAALREWKLLQSLALGFAGVLAIAYSLQAELTFMAMSRGDMVAQRQGDAGAGKRAEQRYTRAEAELSLLMPTRPTAELQAEIDGLLLRPGADGCTAINGKVTREVCPKVAELRAELARSQRRAELANEMHDAEVAQSRAPPVANADPGATALATYAETFGLKVSPELLGQWLPLIGVLALEVGSALGVVLTRYVSPQRVPMPMEAGSAVSQRRSSERPADEARKDDETPSSGTPGRGRPREIEALIASCTESGAKVSQRQLAKALHMSKSSVNRMLHELAAAGELAVATSRSGTSIALTA